MMDFDKNPYGEDTEHHAIWELLVRDWTEAMFKQDFSLLEHRFLSDGFWTMDARGAMHMDAWRLKFTNFAAYKENWTPSIKGFMAMVVPEKMRMSVYNAIMLRDIEIKDDLAIAHIKFKGSVPIKSGPPMHIEWRTLCHLRKVKNVWKVTSLIENLPFTEKGRSLSANIPFEKIVPPGASQHKTAGPYSPVLTIRGQELVVISGQVAISPDGKVIGTTIEEQSRETLANARRQLQTAGIGFENVFKVNVYLTDLANWPKFNEIYKSIMPEPLPARTAIASGLLEGFLVELDMWAMK